MRSALILDDDRDTLEVLQMALELEGIKVDVATNPEKALSQMGKGGYCILFVDFFIPSMDLEEFLKNVRQGSPDLPIVLMSGMAEIQEKGRELRVNAVLAKPFNIDQLLGLVQEHCP